MNSIKSAYEQALMMHKRQQDAQDFGLPSTLSFDDFYALYERSTLAHAIVHRFADGVFSSDPVVVDGDNEQDVHDETPFENQVKKIARDLKLWNKVKGGYWRNRIGSYAALYLVFDDGETDVEPTKGSQCIRIQPLYESQLLPSEYDSDIASVRYGQPIMYRYQSNPMNQGLNGGLNQGAVFTPESRMIHWSRVIIIAEGADDDTIVGTSALEGCYNSILQYDTIIHSCGVGYRKAARGSLILSSNEGDAIQDIAKQNGMPREEVVDALSDEIDDWQNGMTKALVLGKLQAQEFVFNLPDPEHYIDVCLNSVAACCGCPTQNLIGSQLSQKSSDTNADEWAKVLSSIQVNTVNPVIEDIVNRLIQVGSIEAPQSGEFRIYWEDLLAPSDEDKLARAATMTSINAEAVKAGSEPIFTESEIRDVAGFDPIDGEVIDYPND